MDEIHYWEHLGVIIHLLQLLVSFTPFQKFLNKNNILIVSTFYSLPLNQSELGVSVKIKFVLYNSKLPVGKDLLKRLFPLEYIYIYIHHLLHATLIIHSNAIP
jgi:hypothetical protein